MIKALAAQLAGTTIGLFIMFTTIASFSDALSIISSSMLFYLYSTFPIFACCTLLNYWMLVPARSLKPTHKPKSVQNEGNQSGI